MMDEIKKQDFSRLDASHHIFAGMKAMLTYIVEEDSHTARRACGGAGYQSNSGFTQIYGQVSPYPTFEGDNTVMLGQSVRYLQKLFQKVSSGKKVPFPFAYLNKIQETLSLRNQARNVDDFLNLDILDRALQARACNLIASTMKDYISDPTPAKIKDNDTFYQAKIIMIKAHLKYIMFHIFRTSVEAH